MDRREALKRLALGGAVVAGAPLIISSPVFADSGTAPCLPTNCALDASFTVTTGTTGLITQNWIVVTVTSPLAAVCALGQTASVQYRYRTSGQSDPPGNRSPVVRDSTRATLLAATGVWTAFTPANSVTITNDNVNNNLNSATSPSTRRYTIEVIARLVCTSGATKCWCCKGYSMLNGTWTSVYTPASQGTFSVTSTDCDTPAP